jgi:hypothetical protein
MKNPMNIIDFMSLIPFYIALLLEGLEDYEIIGKAGKILRLLKVNILYSHFSSFFNGFYSSSLQKQKNYSNVHVYCSISGT